MLFIMKSIIGIQTTENRVNESVTTVAIIAGGGGNGKIAICLLLLKGNDEMSIFFRYLTKCQHSKPKELDKGSGTEQIYIPGQDSL